MIGQIGKMDTRIVIQRPASSVDSQGSVIDEWGDLAAVWAESKALTGNESASGNERVATQDYSFKIRHQSALASLATTDRLAWKGAYFDILSAAPMPEGRPDQILITARRSSFVTPVSFFTYLRPDGVSTYRRPDGTSIFNRP